MTRGQITIEKNANYIVCDEHTNELRSVETITTQSVYAALARTTRGISWWRMREEILALGGDVLSIDSNMRRVADAWAAHFDAITNGGLVAITGVYGKSADQFKTSIGVNAEFEPDVARAGIAGMLTLGVVSKQSSMIIVDCNENKTKSDLYDGTGVPCLWVYREEPDENEYGAQNIVLNHKVHAGAIKRFPMHDEALFRALGIEYRQDRQLRVWDFCSELFPG